MKIAFNQTFLDLDDKPVKDQAGNPIELHKWIANVIMQASKGDAMKMFDWADQLYKKGVIDLDNAGQVEFKKIINDLEGPALLIKARVLQIIDKANEKK